MMVVMVAASELQSHPDRKVFMTRKDGRPETEGPRLSGDALKRAVRAQTLFWEMYKKPLPADFDPESFLASVETSGTSSLPASQTASHSES